MILNNTTFLRIGLSQKDKVSRFRKRETVNLLSFRLNVGKSDKNIINLIKKKTFKKNGKTKRKSRDGSTPRMPNE